MIVGRVRELALIEGFLRRWRAGRSSPAALVVRGDAGMGKTLLADHAVRGHRRDGDVLLRARGHPDETRLAFAALHQILHPVLAELDGLPDGPREALRAAFALDGAATPPPEPVGRATAALLSGLARRAPVLVVADDLHWYDPASLEAIACAAGQVAGQAAGQTAGQAVGQTAGQAAGQTAGQTVGRRIAVLACTRGDVPGAFGTGVAEVELGPLPADAAELLASRQPNPPAGPLGRRLLRQAGGNPLAVIELAAMTGATALWPGEHFPVTERLERTYATLLARVPPAAGDLLVLMAAADDAEWPAVLRAAPGDRSHALAEAERAGLLDLGGDRPAFRYPLIRSALYQATPFERRRAAHLELARVADDPDRRAWHLGAAAAGPDEEIAGLLEAAGDRAGRRGAPARALAAAERAARLTPDSATQAGRLVKAARYALFTERVGKVEDYTAAAAALTEDPEVLAALPPLVGWAISNSGRQDAAVALLVPAAREAAAGMPCAAVGMLAVAGLAAFHSGLRGHREEIGRCLPPPSGPDDPVRLWVSVCADPLGRQEEVRAAVERERAAPRRDFAGRLALGLAAALADVPEAAIDLLGPLLDPEGDAALPDSNSVFLTFYGFACLDAGRWREAGSVAAHAVRISHESNPGLSTAMALSLQAMLCALRGRGEEARTLAHRALTTADAQSRIVAVRAGRALGLAAAAEGNPEVAHNHFRRLFAADGTPVHDHHSFYALADLAAAAALTGHTRDAALVLDAAEPRVRANARLNLLTRTARGLLASSFEEGVAHFAAVLDDPAGEPWPFERARARLEYGQRLRRGRRIAAARRQLTEALTVFERLEARPWAARARAELQASGVRPDGSQPPEAARPARPAEPAALGRLTAQERRIVRLAARGLSNKEIGERLFLSHRTVSTHLYRIFPKLGISTRAQLHGFATEDEDDPEGPGTQR
ncbi:AAA family ATPase [Nonomuraea sp. NPDC050783]|uniref:helix-turn-helix transcriptional regulator n=1 Tax=Nonomuraea sp. NPDC050783 TaxID=3154634 RepID=UPI003465E4D4